MRRKSQYSVSKRHSNFRRTCSRTKVLLELTISKLGRISKKFQKLGKRHP